MTLPNVIKLIAAILVLLILGGTAWFVYEIFGNTAQPKIAQKSLLDSLEEQEMADIELGDRAFAQAAQLLSAGRYKDARENLQLISTNYPEANAAKEARRILGQMNLDQLLATQDMTHKVTYTVKRGDTYFGIAGKHNTNLPNLVLLNNLNRIDRLQPNDKLILLPLDTFSIIIDPTRKRLTLQQDNRFVTSYPILHVKLPSDARGLWTAKIAKTLSTLGDRSYPAYHPNYLQGRKEIHLDKSRLKILPHRTKINPASKGFFLHPHHLEELTLLVKKGTPIQIRFPKK